MAINFPDNPSPNTVFTDNGISWKWDGTTWEGISSTTTTTLNDIGDVNVGTTITDGHVLKWDLSSTKWVAGPDLTSSGGSGIALTDISVIKPNPAASGSGDVTYSSTSGAFTYTPPVIPTVPTDISAFNNDSGYLTSYTVTSEDLNNLGVGSLGDVSTTGASVNDVLKWDGSNWSPAADAGGITLTNFSVVKPNPSASGGGDVTYDNTTGEFTYTPPSIPAAQVQSDWNSTSGLGEILNKPTLPSNLSDLANVSSTAPNNNEVLKWNGSAWAPAADGGGGGASSADPIGTITIWSGTASNIPTGYQLCDGSASATTELQAIRSNVPDLRDRFVVGSGSTYGENDTGGSADAVVVAHEHTTNIDGGHVIPGNGGSSYSYGGAGTYSSTVFNMNSEGVSGTDKNLPPYWALCYIIKNAATATSGGGEANVQADWNESSSSSDAYIQNKPTLFSGSYTDLTNKPTLFSGSYTDLTSKPTLFSGSYTDLTNKPTIPATLDNLSDVSLGSVSEGKILKYTSGSWSAEDESSGGSGEANVQADWNESSSSSDAYIQNKPTLFSGNYNDLTNQPSIPGAQSQVDWSQSNSTAIDFIKNKPTNVSAFTNDAGYITSASVPSGVPSGTIVMYNGSSAPSGWVICNGSNNTPDLRDKFILAAGSTYSVGDTGGNADAIVVSHSHGSGNFGTNNTGGHTHGQGNLSTNNTGGHTHGQGNLSTNNTGSHSHTQSGSGSGTTGTQSHNHYHTTSANVTIGGGSHSHTFAYTQYDDSGTTGLDINVTSEGDNISNHGTSSNSHNHNFNFTQDTLGVSQNHTHDFNFNIGGNTGSDGSHSHNLSGNTGTNGDHSHNLSGNTGTNGDHSHTISGNSSSQGSSGSGANLPPYYTLTFIMKT